MRTQGEEGHLPVKERGFRRNQPCFHLDFGLPASRTVRPYVSVPSSLWYSVMAARANAYNLVHLDTTGIYCVLVLCLGTRDMAWNNLSVPSRAHGQWGRQKTPWIIIMG